jgi:glycine/D-amino acid oxidase-like deaminating enzyme
VRAGSAWEARTPATRVRARRLVLATDAYTGALWPALRSAFATWHVALVASAPYPQLSPLLPRGIPVADMGLANTITLREATGQRIATTTFAPLRRGLGAARIAALFERKFRCVFPAAPLPRWEHVHFGEIGISHDMLPHLCRIGPDA